MTEKEETTVMHNIMDESLKHHVEVHTWLQTHEDPAEFRNALQHVIPFDFKCIMISHSTRTDLDRLIQQYLTDTTIQVNRYEAISTHCSLFVAYDITLRRAVYYSVIQVSFQWPYEQWLGLGSLPGNLEYLKDMLVVWNSWPWATEQKDI